MKLIFRYQTLLVQGIEVSQGKMSTRAFVSVCAYVCVWMRESEREKRGQYFGINLSRFHINVNISYDFDDLNKQPWSICCLYTQQAENMHIMEQS